MLSVISCLIMEPLKQTNAAAASNRDSTCQGREIQHTGLASAVGVANGSTNKGNEMDKLTTKIAAEVVAMFDAAVSDGDFEKMQEVVNSVVSSPNQPFKREVMRQIGL